MAKSATKTTSRPNNPEKFVVELEHTKETPGTFVFKNSGDDVFVPQLYVKKFAYPDGAPAAVKITVEIINP